MLRNQKWSSWCVCVCVWNHSSVSGIQLLSRMFPRRKCRWWKKEKNKWQEWSLPSLLFKAWTGQDLHCTLWGTLCSPPHKLLLNGCCSSFPWWHQWATVQFPGNDSSYLNHHPNGWYFVPPLTVPGWRKKETSPELSCPWILNTQFCPNLGHSGWNALSSSLAAAAAQVLWNEWNLGRDFRSRSNSTANLHWNKCSFVW